MPPADPIICAPFCSPVDEENRPQAEGQVTEPILRALAAQRRVHVIQMRNHAKPIAGATVEAVPDTPPAPVRGWTDRLAVWRSRPTRHSPRGMLARLVAWWCLRRGRTAPAERSWTRRAAEALVGAIDAADNPVIWARVLPASSFAAALTAAEARPDVPVVANFNDPVPRSMISPRNRWTNDDRRQGVFTKALLARCAAVTGCNHFLLDDVARVYGIDRQRCAVVPHATGDGPADPIQPRSRADLPDGAPWRLLVASALYGSQRHVWWKWMADVARGLNVEWVIAVKGDADSVAELKAVLPSARLHRNLPPAGVAALSRECDASVLREPDRHRRCLKTRTAEAVATDLPIFAVAAADSITADVVGPAGGTLVDWSRVGPAGATDALRDFLAGLADPARRAAAAASRCEAHTRFDHARLARDVLAVLDFALADTRARSTGGNRPDFPSIPNRP
jgi:hypothetical protein